MSAVSLAPPHWTELARCREVDGDLFFPERGESTAPAKKVCAGCEVRSECLNYALERNERFGVYGGLSERERRLILAGRELPVVTSAPVREGEKTDRGAARRAAIEAAGEKVCTQCGPPAKPLSVFDRDREGWRGNCKECRTIGDRRRRQQRLAEAS